MVKVVEVVAIHGVAPWTVKRDQESKRYVGTCDVLNLSTEADSWPEIVKMTQDVMGLLFTALCKDNELEEFLRERGFSIQKQNMALESEHRHPQFDMPSPIFFTPEAVLA